ncbi:MAG: MTH1187 family thiamine-binding protein [Candidatus Lernaella stagnicola]|nr:MTH1187 family thiamine-binding protein [Candidatus Lernaella stagnicola]
MPIAQLTVVPLGTTSTSLSATVAKVQQAICDTGIKYQLTPMCTILEGDLGDVMAAVMAAHEAAFQAGHARVSTTLVLDDRRDKETSMEQKVEAVEEKLAADD